MTDEILRETNGNTLTMAMIGCLPDNVQQSIKSFSIRPGSQHVTFCFPFMVDIIRSCRADSCGSNYNMQPRMSLSQGLFFDHSFDVVEGYQSFITLAPVMNRVHMPVVIFTIYQKDTTEGLVQHFQSIIKIVLDNKTLLSVWKMPLFIVDLKAGLLDLITDSCAQTIVEIQLENLLNTFHGKSKDDLVTYVKEKLVVPNIHSYEVHFQMHLKEMTSSVRTFDPEPFLAIVNHLRSANCSTLDFQKADIMIKAAPTDPLIRCFWRTWGQEQICCKVFPVAAINYRAQQFGSVVYPLVKGSHLATCTLSSFTNLSIRDGLQSIIKCLKAQDTSSMETGSGNNTIKRCSCQVCKSSSPRYKDSKYRNNGFGGPDLFKVQSAFYKPIPTTRQRYRSTATPYSDALKAAAVLPGRCQNLDNRHLSTSKPTGSQPLPETKLHLTPHYMHMCYYSLAQPTTACNLPAYPVLYKPTILTHNEESYNTKSDTD